MKLSAYLEKHKLSKAAFAKQLGLSRASVCRYVNDEMKPSARITKLIEEVTRGAVRPNDLYS
jgi:predicted transcriptional regulator